MFRILRLKVVAPFVLGFVALLASPLAALADFQLSWSVNNTLIGSDPTNTSFTFDTGLVSGFRINGSANGTNSGAFAVDTAGMDLSSLAITSTAPGDLTIVLTQNNLTTPIGLGNLHSMLTGHFVTGSGTVSMVSYGNDTNGLYGFASGQTAPPPPTGGLTNVATAAVGLGGSADAAFDATAPYSLTQILTVHFDGSGTVSLSSDGTTTFSVPGPAGLVLAGTGILGLVGFRIRRRKTIA